MKKPTVYLDTNVISAYWYEGEDQTVRTRRVITRDWWSEEGRLFSLWVSATTSNELEAGRFRRQADCVRMAGRFRRLAITASARQLAKDLVSSGVVPATKEADALQMAVSAAHEMDYLLTWNYAHLANPVAQEHLDAVCRRFELRAPLVVSPETIPQHRLGQQIWRRKT